MNESKEIWKDIVNYEGLYKVSNLGRVFSCRKLSPIKHKFWNSFTIKLFKNEKMIRWSISTLIKLSFNKNEINSNQEIWKKVKNYENLYEISNFGDIRKTRMLKSVDTGFYLFVVLSYKNKTKRASIHSLVAKTFIPNPDNLPEVHQLILIVIIIMQLI